MQKLTLFFIIATLGLGSGSFSAVAAAEPDSIALAKYDSLVAQGGDWLSKKKYALAVEEYTKALKVNPKGRKALMKRGYSFEKLDEHSKALADYSAILKADSSDLQIRFLRTGVYGKLKQYDKEVSDYSYLIEQADKLGPTIQDSLKFMAISILYTNRAAAYCEQNKYQKASEDLKAALANNPSDKTRENAEGLLEEVTKELQKRSK